MREQTTSGREIEFGENGVRRHMVIPYQGTGLPWWHGRGMFRMIHEMYVGEYLRKRDVDDKRNTGPGYIPSSTGVVGFWVSKDGLTMSATDELARFVLVGMEPSDKEFFDREVSRELSGPLFWHSYVSGYLIREVVEGELSPEWTWVKNPQYAGFTAGMGAPVPVRPNVSDEFMREALRLCSGD
jgi:hypothetical protein